MTVIEVPALEPEGAEWPSLGGQVVRWIEEHLTFGPGDLRGEPAKVDAEKRAFVYRMYEVYPEEAMTPEGKQIGGRRRFRRCALVLRKGLAKTELAAWLAAVELHPEGPVRCVGWRGGRPIGGPVTDPYIPMVAYTEEQTEDLAYGALKAILENSRVKGDFDIGLERIMRRTGDGKAVALAGSPNARDGARTTFAHKDETHRWTSGSLNRAHRTMIANLPKRFMADPWELETTTAWSPGEGSVAESTYEYARAVLEGKVRDSALFYFHRMASDSWTLRDEKGSWNRDQLHGALLEASGPSGGWSDFDGIVRQWEDPEADTAYLERVWLNRPIQASAQAFNVARWRESRMGDDEIAAAKQPGELITLGFDGSIRRDATALVATHVRTGLQWPLGWWERPATVTTWEVPREEVDAAVTEAFARYNVWRMNADPSKWETDMANWAGRFGEKRVAEWPTSFYRKMALALKSYAGAIEAGEVRNDGDARLQAHLGNAIRNPQRMLDDEGQPMWLIQKDRPDSPHKIDGAMAGCLSWQARLAAVAAGEPKGPTTSVYEERGLRRL